MPWLQRRYNLYTYHPLSDSVAKVVCFHSCLSVGVYICFFSCQRDNSWIAWDSIMKFLQEQDMVKRSE